MYVIVAVGRQAWLDVVTILDLDRAPRVLGNLIVVGRGGIDVDGRPLQPAGSCVAASAAGVARSLDVLALSTDGQSTSAGCHKVGLPSPAVRRWSPRWCDRLRVGRPVRMDRGRRARARWSSGVGYAGRQAPRPPTVQHRRYRAPTASARRPRLGGRPRAGFVLAGLRMESTRSRRATDRAHAGDGGARRDREHRRPRRPRARRHDPEHRRSLRHELRTASRSRAPRVRRHDRTGIAATASRGRSDVARPEDRRGHAGVHVRRTRSSRGRSCRDCTTPRPATARCASRRNRACDASIDARWLAEATRQGIENALKFSPADTPIDLSRAARRRRTPLIEVADRRPGHPARDARGGLRRSSAAWRPYGL